MSKKEEQKLTKTKSKEKDTKVKTASKTSTKVSKSNSKKNNNNNKSIVIILSIIVVILLILFIGYKAIAGGYTENASAGRCTDSSKYALSNEQIDNMKSVFADISEVDEVKIWTNVCTVKILVNLENDVELDTMKTKATEMLTKLDSDQLSYFDYSFYITSKNDESTVYPIMVSKNKQRSDFAW